ncbi:MAG TPA: hypothetical protein VK966_10120, partial [Longimicrobiales bacterium]|nr:hypothetical protein [Longimicrobiales bacterium]
ILEGMIQGDLVLVEAGAFVRPDARVEGDLVNVAGGLYRSEVSHVGGTILDLATATYRVEHQGRVHVIIGAGAPSPLDLDGVLGFHVPTYDRVNGITAVWGATLYAPMLGEMQPFIHGEVGWRTQQGEPVYGASAGVRRGPYVLEGGYQRRSSTNERWIRGDGNNTLNYLWSGRDYRDYHDVERAWSELSRVVGDEEKSFFGRVAARFQTEDAASLRGGDPWHIQGDSARPNPAIDDGRTTSAMGIVEVEWRGIETSFEGGLTFEQALDALDGDFTFSRLTATGEWAMRAFANHTLEVEGHGQLPLSGDPLPRQRWSFVGGSGTLQTLEFAQFRGDHVAYVETKYIIPAPRHWALPILGAPDLELIHATGMAWLEGEDSGLHQEIGARLQFFALYFRYMFEPDAIGDGDLDISLSWPFGGDHPWIP